MTDSTISPLTKRCSKCSETKPTTEFHNDKSRKDGKHPYCKACYYAYCQEKRNRKDFTPPSEKWCNKCQRTLPASMFNLARAKASGLFVHCKECVAQWRDVNIDRLRETARRYSKAYYQAHRDVCRAKHREWYAANRVHKAEYWKRWYAGNSEWIAAYRIATAPQVRVRLRAYRKANPMKVATWKQNRRTRIAGNGGSFTAKDIANMQYIQQGHCCYCGRVGLPFAIDHIIPVKQGGPSDSWNLALCCKNCNSQKHDRTLEEWTDRWYLR